MRPWRRQTRRVSRERVEQVGGKWYVSRVMDGRDWNLVFGSFDCKGRCDIIR